MTMASSRRATFLGAPLDLLDMTQTVEAIEDHLARCVAGAHLGVNAANLVLAHDDHAYRALLHDADLVTADGQSVVWGARAFGHSVPERVTGIDLMVSLLAASRSHGWSVYLLGAQRETVARLAAQLRITGVQVAGFRDGFFPAGDARAVAADVTGSGADLLFVGMPSPRKERFIVEVARPAGVAFSVGVGGSFDVLAGDLRRAPPLAQRLGMEWAFRLLQEPRRLVGRYAISNTRFIGLMVQEAARRKLPGRR